MRRIAAIGILAILLVAGAPGPAGAATGEGECIEIAFGLKACPWIVIPPPE